MTEPLEPLPGDTAELTVLESPYDQIRMARVNLLPAEVTIHRSQRRIATIALGVLAAYLVGLAGLYVLKLDRVDEARAERDRTEHQVAVLRAEAESLNEYQRLLDTLENRETLLTSAMEDELSWARILGELALSFDRQASLIGVQAASAAADAAVAAAGGTAASATAPPPDAEAGAFDLGDPVASIEFTGYSVDRFAPGVEDVLANFDDADGFFDSYLSTAGEEERGETEVTNFIGRVQLDDAAYTHRYDDGLPEESVQ